MIHNIISPAHYSRNCTCVAKNVTQMADHRKSIQGHIHGQKTPYVAKEREA
jgi:hypothetical protein